MKSRVSFAGYLALFTACAGLLHANPVPLSITNVGGGITVFWPVTGGDWALEGSPALSPAASWSPVAVNSDETNGVIRRIQIGLGDTNRFFRLRRLGSGEPGLTGDWQLDEGTGSVAQDGSGAGGILSIVGANWTSGRIGTGALQFNGNGGSGGSRCWVSNSNYRVLPRPGQPFSVSFWFSPDTLAAGWRGLAGTDANGSNGWHVALLNSGPGTNLLIFAGAGPGGSLSVTGRTLLLPRQWYQLTATHDGSVGSLYLDGVRLASGSGAVPVHEGPVFFGGGVGGFNSFLGRIDDIQTFTKCLTDEMIALAGEWRFDEGFGQFTGDSSGRGQHAMLSDLHAWTVGRNGGGVDLSSGLVAIPNNDLTVLPPSGKPFSISFWLRPNLPHPGRYGLMSCGSGGTDGWQLDVSLELSGQTLLHFASVASGGTLDLSVPVALVFDAWSKLDITFNGGVATIYCNGRKAGTGNGAIRGSHASLTLGASSGLAAFPAVIDELKIHRREVGESEIGPVAPVMWETVLMNTATNFALRGSGPPDRPLVYAIDPTITPTNGTVSIPAGSSMVTYVAGARKGPDAFTYTVSDGTFTSPPTTFRVSVVEPRWLSPEGGSGAPLDGRSPSRAWRAGTARALDAIWKTNSYYDCFLYAPGEYQTTGWRYLERATANSGCKHVGSGSEGPGKTTIKLVDIWSANREECIFGPLYNGQLTDDFEIQHVALDCNGDNIPKYVTGEPVWIRVPLNSAGRVDSVTIRWGGGSVPGTPVHQIGRPELFSVRIQRSGVDVFVTNCVSTGATDFLPAGVVGDELLIQLEKRAVGVDYYGVRQIDLSGPDVSVPSATAPGAGESRLDSRHAVFFATDGDLSTSWASGPEAQATLMIPLSPSSAVTRIKLNWNCKTLEEGGRLGAASAYSVQARNESTGGYEDVPFARSPRDADGTEVISFGSTSSPLSITSDRIAITLTMREGLVDYYSLREVTLWNGAAPVLIRQPTSLNTLGNADFCVAQAFDHDPESQWASGSQGAVVALVVEGSNLKFVDLAVVGFGTKAGRECFPLFVGPPFLEGYQPMGNVLVENCRLSNPATKNRDGLTAVFLAGNQHVKLTNAIVKNCSVIGMRPYFAFYSQGIAANQIENCTVSDCMRAVYFEPERVNLESPGPVLIRSNQFLNVDSGVYFTFHPGAQFDSVTCVGNEIVLSGRMPFQWGIAACDVCFGGPSGSITEFVALQNVIRYAGWLPQPAGVDGGLFYSDIRHAVFANNLIALGTSSALRVRGCPAGTTPSAPPFEDCDHFNPGPPDPPTPIPCTDILRPGYRRAWFNNRDLGGTVLQVRTYNNGVDMNALEQQWAE